MRRTRRLSRPRRGTSVRRLLGAAWTFLLSCGGGFRTVVSRADLLGRPPDREIPFDTDVFARPAM